MNDLCFKNKVVLITGAGKGTGRVLAEALGKLGACIAANDISPINVDEVVNGINARGGKAKAFIDDVAKKVAVQALIKNVEDEFGRLDALIVHAAVEPHTPLLDMDEWDWHRVLDVNLTGAFLMIQSVGRVMRANSKGLILTLISGSGREVHKDAAAYSSSMAGLRELSNAAGQELSKFGIQIHAIENRGGKTVEEVLFILEEAWMKELMEYRVKLIERLAEAAHEFRSACEAVTEPFAPVDEGGWNVHQLAAHARDVDKFVYGMRAKRTAAEENPVFQNFDADAWMADHYKSSESLAEILSEFEGSVNALVGQLRALPTEAWSRESRHETLGGGFALQTWVERELAHIEEHLATVKKAK